MLDFVTSAADNLVTFVNTAINNAGPVIAAIAAVVFFICLVSTGKGK